MMDIIGQHAATANALLTCVQQTPADGAETIIPPVTARPVPIQTIPLCDNANGQMTRRKQRALSKQ